MLRVPPSHHVVDRPDNMGDHPAYVFIMPVSLLAFVATVSYPRRPSGDHQSSMRRCAPPPSTLPEPTSELRIHQRPQDLVQHLLIINHVNTGTEYGTVPPVLSGPEFLSDQNSQIWEFLIRYRTYIYNVDSTGCTVLNVLEWSGH